MCLVCWRIQKRYAVSPPPDSKMMSTPVKHRIEWGKWTKKRRLWEIGLSWGIGSGWSSWKKKKVRKGWMPGHTQKMAWRMIVGYTCIFIRPRDPRLPELSCTWKIKVYINSWTWIQTLQVEYAGAFSEAPEPKFRSGNQTTRQPMSGTRGRSWKPLSTCLKETGRSWVSSL